MRIRYEGFLVPDIPRPSSLLISTTCTDKINTVVKVTPIIMSAILSLKLSEFDLLMTSEIHHKQVGSLLVKLITSPFVDPAT